jgi:serine/threonine-protein kinase/endoribonuclease IRE1
VAVFDVVKSARKQSPFVLLQPRLRLQDIFPSTIHQGDYPDDETAFVGLVPGTGSLFALSPDHFPLVAFSESAPAERIEGSEAVIVSGEHGTLQCFEGTTDRQCLTGVRALRADSRSRLARLLDGVPGPATTPLPSATGDPARSENANSQAYVEDEPLIVPGEGKPSVLPWEWVNGVEEALSQGQKKHWAPSSSVLLALVSVFASLLWFNRKVPSNRHNSAVHMNAGPVPDKLVREMPTDGNVVSIAPLELTSGAARTPPLESQAVETRPNVKTTPPEISVLASTEFATMALEPSTTTPGTASDVPMPLSATGGNVKVSPVKAESHEGAEDVGEVKKKHRKRRRRRKGDAKDAAADGGEEPENEDGEGEDGNAVSPGILSLGPPSTPVPPTLSSLVVSDTILGMSSITYVR